jgi:hypothetical protein
MTAFDGTSVGGVRWSRLDDWSTFEELAELQADTKASLTAARSSRFYSSRWTSLRPMRTSCWRHPVATRMSCSSRSSASVLGVLCSAQSSPFSTRASHSPSTALWESILSPGGRSRGRTPVACWDGHENGNDEVVYTTRSRMTSPTWPSSHLAMDSGSRGTRRKAVRSSTMRRERGSYTGTDG